MQSCGSGGLDYDVFRTEKKVVEVEVTKTVDVEFDLFDPSTWSGQKTVTETVMQERTYIRTNDKFDWNSDKYSAAVFDMMNTKTEFKGMVVSPDTKIPRGGPIGKGKGYSDKPKNVFWVTTENQPYNGNKFRWSYGGTALHEMINHFHPLGNSETSPGLQIHFNLPLSKEHAGAVITFWSPAEIKRLKELRSETGEKKH